MLAAFVLGGVVIFEITLSQISIEAARVASRRRLVRSKLNGFGCNIFSRAQRGGTNLCERRLQFRTP